MSEEQTRGDWLVGRSFNPSGNEAVDLIKRAAAALIDFIHSSDGDPRCQVLAVKAIEEGAMWAVKSVTKQPQPGAAE